MEVKFIDILAYTVALIGFCPYVVVMLLSDNTVTASLFVLMYFINPIYCIMVGIVASKNVKKNFVYIFLPAIVFIIAYTVIFKSLEVGFVFYGFVYLIISLITMLIGSYLKKRKEELYS
ncbi:MAG: hypothetical protein QM204_05525 [Bacillota bacterium]|mgnify:CR=1 FL=1|jgi:hypothetical protein|nr:hypothetical protein [Bacillota bacterium]NLL27155.1 hypothetical protein [Erysipelotrichia bacterium]